MTQLLAIELGLIVAVILIAVGGFRGAPWVDRAPRRGLRAVLVGEWREASRGERAAWLAVVALAFLVRAYHLTQPLRGDEAYTYLRYASSPLADALTDYSYPNNHLFHTLLVWLSTRWFGDSTLAIRLPAFVAGMLLVPGVYALARRFASRSDGLLAMAMAAAWPTLILYATNARGYSIIALAFVALLLLADLALDRDAAWPWLAIAVVIALGMYTAPVMLYPAGVVMLWMLVERARRSGTAAARAMLPRLVATGMLAALLTVMLDLPVVLRGGLAPLVSNKYVRALTPAEFVADLPRFLGDLVVDLGVGIPRVLLVALMAVGLAGVLATGDQRPRRVRLAIVALAWSVALLVATRHAPPARVWLFLVPLASVYIGVGFRVAVEWLARRLGADARTLAGGAAVVLVLALGGGVSHSRAVFRSPETGTLVDAPQIADWLATNLKPGDRIAVVSPCDGILDYYLRRRAGRSLAQINGAAGRGRVFVVVNPRHLQTVSSVQQSKRKLPWGELVEDGPVVDFQPETIHVFRYASAR